MPFSPKTKYLARRRAAFRCCVCQATFVEIHHLIPESEGGESTIENAAPLCARCHDLYGGNPEKRAQLRQMRDDWWEKMELRHSKLTDPSEEDPPYEIVCDPDAEEGLRNRKNTMYYCVKDGETFEESAKNLLNFIYLAQCDRPNVRRMLYIDIIGNYGKLDKKSGRVFRFNDDMMELQFNYIGHFLIKYVSEVHMPIWHIKNKKMQNNDVPKEINIVKGGSYKDAIGLLRSGEKIDLYFSDGASVMRLSGGEEGGDGIEVVRDKGG